MRVAVGTPAQTQIPPQELPRNSGEYLSGIRCIATQLKSESPDAALTAMLRQRWDALVLLALNGSKTEARNDSTPEYVKEAYLAHLVPDSETPWVISPPLSLDALSEQDFNDLVEEWETEFQESGFGNLSEVESNQDKVLLVALITEDVSQQQFEYRRLELVRLVESARGIVVGTVQQKRSRPHPQTVVGQGKVEEIALLTHQLRADVIIFDRDISPSQVRNLEDQIGIPVVDRTGIILDIFAQRTQSQAGKLQVELAQLEYMLPRLRGRGREMSRLGGGIGTRGPGETKLETEPASHPASHRPTPAASGSITSSLLSLTATATTARNLYCLGWLYQCWQVHAPECIDPCGSLRGRLTLCHPRPHNAQASNFRPSNSRAPDYSAYRHRRVYSRTPATINGCVPRHIRRSDRSQWLASCC